MPPSGQAGRQARSLTAAPFPKRRMQDGVRCHVSFFEILELFTLECFKKKLLV